MKYQAIIFDLDGTLLDTLQDLADSTNFALETMGFPKRTIAEIRSFVGNGVAQLIKKAVPNGTSEDIIQKTLSVFKEHYAVHCEDMTRPYDGIIFLLDMLLKNGCQIAVVSNKIESAVQQLCEKYFGGRISVCIGDREGMARKPAPDSVFSALHRLNVQAKDAVYIGDSEVDIQTAKNAEMDMIGVTWGFRDQADLKEQGARVFADSAESLAELLLNENFG